MTIISFVYSQQKTDSTFDVTGIHIGAELSFTSNFIIPRPQRAETRKQHRITVHGLEAMP